MNTKAECVPRHLTRAIHDSDNADRERARLLRRGQLEVITDQLDGDAQGIMLVALLLEGGLHLAEFLL